jgi:hypothetical protein
MIDDLKIGNNLARKKLINCNFINDLRDKKRIARLLKFFERK